MEPNSAHNFLLQEKRLEDINLQTGLADDPGLLDLYFVPDTGPSTMGPRITAEHEENGHSIHVETCPVTTLDLIWEKYIEGCGVNFLNVDVEGFEDQVLRMNDWGKHRPWIVVVEATLPNKPGAAFEECEPILLRSGYQFVYADGLNRFYVAREYEDLSSSFQYPPNFFDQIKTVAQAEAEARVAEVEQVLNAELEDTRHELDQSRQRASALETRMLPIHYSKSLRITAPPCDIAVTLREARASFRQMTRDLVVSALRRLKAWGLLCKFSALAKTPTIATTVVQQTLELALTRAGVDRMHGRHRLLSDNGPRSLSGDLRRFLKGRQIEHTRGALYHSITQGKIERYLRAMKNLVELQAISRLWDLQQEIAHFVQYCNHQRYYQSLGNVTPAGAYFDRAKEVHS